MSINRVAVISILVLLTFTVNIHAQTSSITGSVTPEGTVRMIAHGEALQVRMEVYSAAGELVADTGLRPGNIIDWKQTDATQPIIDGSYLVVVTVRDFKGNLNQRMAALTLQSGQLQLQSQKRDEVTTAQVRTIESRQGKSKITEGDDAISILKEGKERAAVVTAHDGTDGQVNSTSGSLTFRTSNVFSNQEQEQMRVTPEGRVGIGTKAPETTLDVAGTIKARGGIQFDDGSVLSSAKNLPTKDAPGAGTGGGSLSGTNVITAINDPATVGSINDSRVSLNLARLAAANTWSSFNTFSAGLSANNAQITNVGNPVNGGDAVNKNYFDANVVRFMPAAQQLTVGDTNGTAPMINLRGQSTCCGPTTGFADFKVFQNGSFVATGNLGIGTSPMEGSGYRTSWHTYKGAFRSGYADNEWNDANVGFFSWAGGSNSTAIGLYSLAF